MEELSNEAFDLIEPSSSQSSIESSDTTESTDQKEQEEDGVENADLNLLGDPLDFSPFPNKEIALFCILMQSVMISKRTGQRILDMLHVPGFSPNNLPKSFASLQQYLKSVPTLHTYEIILEQVIPIHKRKTKWQSLSEFKQPPQTPIVQTVKVKGISIHSIIRQVCASKSFLYVSKRIDLYSLV